MSSRNVSRRESDSESESVQFVLVVMWCGDDGWETGRDLSRSASIIYFVKDREWRKVHRSKDFIYQDG